MQPFCADVTCTRMDPTENVQQPRRGKLGHLFSFFFVCCSLQSAAIPKVDGDSFRDGYNYKFNHLWLLSTPHRVFLLVFFKGQKKEGKKEKKKKKKTLLGSVGGGTPFRNSSINNKSGWCRNSIEH